ncbi:hypothetical protein M9H77_35617 [Catharanthus roseus]|uniref:Uncharacterized protein n=1 Tax=Catharanthus roseus TaxID=4058 RepID=A0ACB9ZPI0_CATRO|nr:hypothetical protein M9H77_35617 [Catharanthus roseus]
MKNYGLLVFTGIRKSCMHPLSSPMSHNKLKVAPRYSEDLKGIMALRFPRFSEGLAQDPTTRRIWFGIATAHDFDSHDDITEESIIFLWTSGNLFHVAWQGNFESWIKDPLHVRPIAHIIWDPHFGHLAMEAFTRGFPPQAFYLEKLFFNRSGYNISFSHIWLL